MPHKWLIFLSLGVTTVIIFVLFIFHLLPIRAPLADKIVALENSGNGLPTATFINPALGSLQAPVKILVFSDFLCSACQQLAASLATVHQTYPTQVQIVWKNLPNQSLHPLASPAAVAAHCADQQNQFWPYHDLLFARQNQLSQDQFMVMAQELGLDLDSFARCVDQQDPLPVIERDLAEAQALGLTATPTLFINQRSYAGALSTASLISYVENALRP
ncbi:DsbA family protein [Patescibacteria group bacterium]|nr:DsbA family protein [Patescibacteria group bacterium]